MAWTLKLSKHAIKALNKIDRKAREKIFETLDEIEKLSNPYSRGKALVGNLKGYWRYRSGDYCIICEIDGDVLLVLIVDVGHRREIYRRTN